ncbi:MAG: DNA-binding transcriptional regulator HxlR family [Candidatus Methanohalarchaeum thermophilum]|uniref:DNA-binding transcriptional regulator HxlR family n=1 Tax=Methanohalarchaeum thermophilum TaxID=1903181 RepID=A0A1Q6DXN2_METT1|nr:MAG: DNA-binding transcriptional regulator HxlR family [Candidatus Methanohalarchaeum thermophilum]
MKESQEKILITLEEREKSFTDLTKETNLSKTVLSKELESLLNSDLINKKEGEKDSRRTIYQLTEKGNEKLIEIIPSRIERLNLEKEKIENSLKNAKEISRNKKI